MLSEESKPRISICLPVFNGADYLAEAIESALQQSFANFELLIADDCSTDSSQAIIEKYALSDQRIIFWTNKERLGLFGNYNACMARARGAYIKLFAQDDLLEPLALAHMMTVLEQYPQVSLASGGKSWIDQSGVIIKRIVQFDDNRIIIGKDAIIANLITLGNWIGEPSVVMFRTKDIGAGFDTNYHHCGDIEYWFRLLGKGDLFYMNEIICGFRRHQSSSTTKNLAGLYFAQDILRLGEQYRPVLSELGESSEHFYKRAIETIALQVDHLVRNEGLTVAGVAAASADSSVSDNTILRQALFHSSRRITDLLTELILTNNELEHRQAECKRLWEAVNQMTNSVSWRLTAPLRTVREKMGSSSIEGGV